MKQSTNVKAFCYVAVAAACMVSLNAYAGADATFNTPAQTLTTWLTGSMGKLFAVGSLAVGLGIGIVKQSVMSVAVGTGLALAASSGPSVLAGIFSATF